MQFCTLWRLGVMTRCMVLRLNLGCVRDPVNGFPRSARSWRTVILMVSSIPGRPPVPRARLRAAARPERLELDRATDLRRDGGIGIKGTGARFGRGGFHYPILRRKISQIFLGGL